MTIKTWRERLEETAHKLPNSALHVSIEEIIEDAMQAEIDELRAELAKECRHIKQAEGKHPEPCARFCESTAYEIALRQLKAENSKLREALAEQNPKLPENCGSGHCSCIECFKNGPHDPR